MFKAIYLCMFLCLSGSIYAAPHEENLLVSNQQLTTIMTQLGSGEGVSTQELIAYKKAPNSISDFINALKKGTNTQRELGVSALVDMGRVMIPPSGDIPEWPGPIVIDNEVVGYLVELLNDQNAAVRGAACIALTALVPGRLIEPHADEIIQSITQFPNTDGAIVLLGKTHSDKAIELLKQENISAVNADDTEMALARLSVKEAHEAVINAYLSETDPQKKAIQARRLGYIASEKAKQILATEIRTPLTYMWHPPARRSLRIHIIEALFLAFPEEAIFWPPVIKPSDDSYYEEIEKWLQQRLGVKWNQPRPEFLYEEDSPIMPSMQ